MSCDVEMLPVKKRPRRAVVITLSKAHDQGHTSCVFCLSLRRDKERNHVTGNPFRLFDKCGWYIWKNIDIRNAGIEEGSIIVVDTKKMFVETTKERVEKSTVLAQLQFGSGKHGVAYSGVAHAFPDAKIPPLGEKGIYQFGRKPDPSCALISIQLAYALDGRIAAITRLDEVLNLSNRGRAHNPCGIKQVQLPVREPRCNDDVGDVILVSFGNETSNGSFQAVCEGILLGLGTEDSNKEDTLELSYMYPMTSHPRGICLIINNMIFQDVNISDRRGSERDEEALHRLFEEELDFEVHVRRDQENLQIQRVAEEFAVKDHSEYDAFVCIVMSHGGDHGTIVGVKGRKIKTEDITSEFKSSKCPTLAGKPKVFITQACRGESRDPNLSLPDDFAADSTRSGFLNDSTLSRGDTPDETDFVFAHSTVPGYVSRRDPDCGSPFIQKLVEVMREFRGKEHFIDMLGIVNSHLARKRIQVAALSTTLTHKLYL